MIFGLGTCPRGQVPSPKPVNYSVYSLKITEMTEKDLNHWIMYHEIHKLNRMGFSASRIASFLGMDARTVRKYLKLTEAQYEGHMLQSDRKKILSPYEGFVASNLKEYPETSTAQIHDWLKECHPDLPQVSPRTVFNFVMFIRQKYNIPYESVPRSFFPVQELAYGYQAQVDFGQYNMRCSNGKRKKVYFFAMVLSRSRMKFVWFKDAPFTTGDVTYAHEKAFGYFGGIPRIIVYDQDRTMVVDENLGEIILTSGFREYSRSRGFELHFCRKSDPQSKGKVENLIQYIKKNFLFNRLYLDNETLNEQAIAWLHRTANHLPHNYTKIAPQEAFREEAEYLTPYRPLTINTLAAMDKYTLRKTNVIDYKSNFYTLPEGTYKGPGSFVMVKTEEDKILIYDKNEQLITSHVISQGQGKTIINTHHKRDTSKSLNDMAQKIGECFTDKSLIEDYLEKIRRKYPRYTRDHFQALLKALGTTRREAADKTLVFCVNNDILHGSEFNQVLQVVYMEGHEKNIIKPIKLLHGTDTLKIEYEPQISDIDDYDKYINQ
jgi:transposase